LKTHYGRIDAAKVVVPILAQIPSDVARSQYAQQWSSKLSIDEIALSADVNRHRREIIRASDPSHVTLLQSGSTISAAQSFAW